MKKRTGRKPKPKAVSVPIMFVEIENPLYKSAHAGDDVTSKRIKAAFNMRESYVGYLFGRGLISPAEKAAGDRVRQAFEAMGGVGAQAIDYSRTKVDGGKIAEPISIHQLEAGKVLRDVHSRLGAEGHDLVIKLAGEAKTPKDLSPHIRTQNYYSMRLRECLEVLAIHWGFQKAKMVSTRTA